MVSKQIDLRLNYVEEVREEKSLRHYGGPCDPKGSCFLP